MKDILSARFTVISAFTFLIILVLVQLLNPARALAYEYLKTDSEYMFNRCYVRAEESSGTLSLYGSDPHSPSYGMPAWDAPSGWLGSVEHYRFLLHHAKGTNELDAYNSPWSFYGVNSGHGVIELARQDEANGRGFGCLATYGYISTNSGCLYGSFGGFDDQMTAEIYIKERSGPDKFYGWVKFWPRVKIVYNANGGTNAPADQYKYMGTASDLSRKTPTRKGYVFEGWSLKPNGEVNLAPGQTIGSQDWNLSVSPYLSHSWNSATELPDTFYSDSKAGISSPTGTNTITLYAVWAPIKYSVRYMGNGATSGTMLNSSHVYDAVKQLSANTYARSYTLTCDARGGSAGVKRQTCEAPWMRWTTNADGTGSAYMNRQLVKNLRDTSGVVRLYAQWGQAKGTLPHPGTYVNHKFDGWYTASSGGVRLGGIGDVITVTKDTTVYAQWKQVVTVNYYVDGARYPMYSEQVVGGGAYHTREEAAELAVKDNCNGLVAWFTDANYKTRYAEGSVLQGATLNLYGYNEVLLQYSLTNETTDLLACQVCYTDEGLSCIASENLLLPQSKTYRYGATVSTPQLGSLWYEDHDALREVPFWPKAFLGPSTDAYQLNSVRLIQNTTLYLAWLSPSYDGIVVQ